MKYTSDLYRLETLTHLYAGARGSTYGIVDKKMQRDRLNGKVKSA